VSQYGITQEADFENSCEIYRQIKSINLFKLSNINYNIYFNHAFISDNFRMLYKLLSITDDTVVVSEKHIKCLTFEEIVKFVYEIKRKMLCPLVYDTLDFDKN
jgi:hypothetical protein